MKERLAYKERCHEALVSNYTELIPKKMSIIIDGMDQSKCHIPYCGGQQTMNKPLVQHITGVKEHGVGLCLYRTIETVGKSANLTIHCILSALEDFYKRHDAFPETLYIQLDGGSENANKYVLAICELIVCKRRCRNVWFSRLLTGHTHEDIDACFGTLWSTFKSHPVWTMDNWADSVEERFGETDLKANVKDVWVIPDICALLEDCIVKDLSSMHRDLQTQHQWRFTAVEISPAFPLGCKTCFRAYSSDQVIELIHKPKELCISEIGRFTGLEPTYLHCNWYPSPQCDPNRPGIEGMYLLEKLPDCGDVVPGSVVPMPAEIPEGAIDAISECLKEVRTKDFYQNQQEVHDWWREFEKTYQPRDMDVVEYTKLLANHGIAYRTPLRDILFNPRHNIPAPSWSESIGDYGDFNPDFKWPEVFARATNSVRSARFNPHPPAPREYVVNDEHLITVLLQWDLAMNEHYAGLTERQATSLQLKELCWSKTPYSGEELCTNSGKNQIVFFFVCSIC